MPSTAPRCRSAAAPQQPQTVSTCSGSRRKGEPLASHLSRDVLLHGVVVVVVVGKRTKHALLESGIRNSAWTHTQNFFLNVQVLHLKTYTVTKFAAF